MYKPESFKFPKIVKYKQGNKRIETQSNGKAFSKVVPDIVEANALNVGLHLIKNFHIVDRLKEKYTDFVALRTCEIFSKDKIEIDASLDKDLTNTPIKGMTKSELLQFVTLLDLNVTLEGFGDLGDMKMAVQRAYTQKKDADKKAGIGPQVSEEDELLKEPQLDIFG